MLGLYVSEHPMMGAERALRRHVECTLTELEDCDEGEMRTVVGGVVTALNRKYTKRGDLMATFVLEDLGAAVEVMVFPRTMADHGHVLEDDAIVCVKGRLDQRDDSPRSSPWTSPVPSSSSTAGRRCGSGRSSHR